MRIYSHKVFFIVFTQNPSSHVGVTVLGEALKDRFIWVHLDYQNPEEEIKIIKQEARFKDSDDPKIAVLSQRIIQRTRESTSLRRGSSIRGAIDLADLMIDSETQKSTQKWVDRAIMALYNKIELEDGIAKTKIEVITDIVLSALNEVDFQ